MGRKINNIIPQMFDVRPINKNGLLDVQKFESVKNSAKTKTINKPRAINNIIPSTSDIRFKHKTDVSEIKKSIPKKESRKKEQANDVSYAFKKAYFSDNEINRFRKVLEAEKREAEKFEKKKISIASSDIKNIKQLTVEFNEQKDKDFIGETEYATQYSLENTDYFDKFRPSGKKAGGKNLENGKRFSFGDIFYFEKYFRPEPKIKMALSFAGKIAFLLVIFLGATLISKGLTIKKTAYQNGEKVFASFMSAKDGLKGMNFEKAAMNFDEAYKNLDQIAGDIDSLGGVIVESSKYVPYLSKLSSGSHLVDAGKDLSKVGALISENISVLEKIKNPKDQNESGVSYLKIFQDTKDNLNKIAELLKSAEENLNSVNADDIPEDQRSKFIQLKEKLPEANKYLSEFVANENIFTDILGGNGPRKYLFLFQNNQEMRATGGFIGTYAVVDIFNGRVRNFFVDGIFNPDGQLQDRIVPPAPIQKISANWSMHDSNWFPDFPKSAEKATVFYEKTGGPTVDGVIALTPVVLEKLLAITGPIEMPEYGITIDKDNFIENIQTEVEENYDKELNQPKKILSDVAPKILDKIFNPDNFSDVAKTMSILSDSLDERHILIYAKNWEIEKVLSNQGWSGEILDTQRDYLSVINTNINGFKTDGVVDEKIDHLAEIQKDGSIIDTVTIMRHHNGGDTPYGWWNKVNADYMRVYVPRGSKLISASGQTREFDSPPLDYNALGYKRDAQVKMEEDSMSIDEASGTRVYDDSNKTVFANWVYVSPKETVEIKYTYLLPFKIDTNLTTRPTDTYSLLVQKQAGSLEDKFSSSVSYPDFYKVLWKYPDGLKNENNSVKIESNLKTDKFIGAAFSKD
jgi:hypothetical protein